MSETQTRYKIDKLLAEAIQPFDALPDEDFAALKADLKRGVVFQPVGLTNDGVLFEGSQRLRALQELGHRYINADKVRMYPKVNKTNAFEWAIKLNVHRRHFSLETKASAARKLQRERGWSQGKIADIFGVSRPAVSQWLARTETDETEASPMLVEGLDGKLQPLGHKERRQRLQRSGPHPWEEEGEIMRLIAKVESRIDNAVDYPETWRGLGHNERDAMLVKLQDLSGHVADLIASLTEDRE